MLSIATVKAVTVVKPSLIYQMLIPVFALEPTKSEIDVAGMPVPLLVKKVDSGTVTVVHPVVVNGVILPALFIQGRYLAI